MPKGGSKDRVVLSRRSLLAGGVGLALVAGVCGGLVANALDTTAPSSSSSAQAAACQATTIARDVLPSVVTITVRKGSSGGTGSGEVITAGGDILTNNHVIALAASGGTITVVFDDGRTAPARLVGRDALTDVAVIRVTGVGRLRPIAIGTSAKVKVGEPVVVLGAPLGLSSTVTSGIVSALDRTVEVPGESAQSALLIDAIQTDAPINPGNSGGAMVDCAGRFIGMPSAGATVPTSSGEASPGSIGLGFAIPADLAIDEAHEIIATGRVAHAYLGLVAAPVSPEAASVSGVAEGLVVKALDPGGPAQAAGLATGDIITAIDGVPATSTTQLVVLTLRKRPGDVVEVGYERDGVKRTAHITLGTQPPGT